MGTRLITWQKKNGDIIKRKVSYYTYRVGYTNSYGWTIINIEYYYNKKFYDYSTYNKLIHKEAVRERFFNTLKNKLTYILKQVIYFFSLAVFIKAFEVANLINV